MLMTWSTINILSLVFIYFIICLRNKEKYHHDFETVTFCEKRLVLIGVQLIKEYQSIVNGLIKTIPDKT